MISATMLSAYLYCKRKLFLERVLKIVEPKKEALVLGKIRHSVFDCINKEDERIIRSITKSLSKKEVEDLYRKSYSKILRNEIVKSKKGLSEFGLDMTEIFAVQWENLLHEIALRSEIVHDFLEREGVFGDELFLRLTPKIESEVYLESVELGLKGIVDKIEVFPDRVVPVELKTGKAPREGVWPGHMMQVGVYLLLLESAGKRAEHGIVYYLDSKDKREVHINPFFRDEVIELARKVEALLVSKDIPDYCATKSKCDSCGIKEVCHAENFVEEKLRELV